MAAQKPVVILGVFVADTAYRAARAPRMGETILGSDFKLGPGGKGSNQAVAAGRLGADVTFVTRLGRDPFADMARATWKDAGVKPAVIETPESYTGAAYIFVEETTGNNAIIVCPGAAIADLARRHRRQCGADPLRRRVRHAARAADRRGDAGAWRSPGRPA